MHRQDRHSRVKRIDVAFGHEFGDSTAAAGVGLAKLGHLPHDAVVVKQLAEPADDLGRGIGRAALAACKKPLTVAVMGCVVNGPGEAREADIGIAGGDGWGTIFEKGQQVDKRPYDELLPALLERIERM